MKTKSSKEQMGVGNRRMQKKVHKEQEMQKFYNQKIERFLQ